MPGSVVRASSHHGTLKVTAELVPRTGYIQNVRRKVNVSQIFGRFSRSRFRPGAGQAPAAVVIWGAHTLRVGPPADPVGGLQPRAQDVSPALRHEGLE